jgi:aminoglycoside phosphotransferase (APT) family kinase protein
MVSRHRLGSKVQACSVIRMTCCLELEIAVTVTMDQRLESLVPIDALMEDLQTHLGPLDEPDVRFLAAGEYSLNFLVRYDGQDVVARCVTGSQMDLAPSAQVQYEAHALDLLHPTGRTPRFISLETSPKNIVYPFMILEYLPGRPLDYAQDLEGAARCMATIHQLRAPENHRLVVHDDPGLSLLDESWILAQPYLNWADAPAGSVDGLRRLLEVVESGLSDDNDPFVDNDLSIVNTDLNSHNFVVENGSVSLLDWERTRIGPAVQDLAHFLIPTTTLWREDSATRLSAADEDLFLGVYLDERPEIDRPRFLFHLQAMKLLAALRAVCWCAWAIQATQTGGRPITNADTLASSRAYLQPAFLEQLAEMGS